MSEQLSPRRHPIVWFIAFVLFCLAISPGFTQITSSLDSKIKVAFSGYVLNRTTGTFDTRVTLTNISADTLQAPISLVINSISSPAVTLANTAGSTADGKPYVVVPVPAGGFVPGGAITTVTLKFKNTNPAVGFTFTYGVMGLLPPIADAGKNLSGITGKLVTLDGSASRDPQGKLLTYAWRIIQAPLNSKATLIRPTTPNPSFTSDLVGAYQFELTVSNGTLNSQPAQVTLTASTVNAPPVTRAGNPQNAKVGAVVNLDGSLSSDPEGTPLIPLWSFSSVPTGSTLTDTSIATRNALKASFVPDKVGIYVLKLTVSDGALSASDTTQITVVPPNVPPNANAGADVLVNLGAKVNLNGTGTSDPDAGPSPLAYAWTFVTKPAGSVLTDANIVGSNTPSASLTPDKAGTYQLKLSVSDGEASSEDAVVVIVNTPPQLLNDTITVNKNTAIDINVLSNDNDPDGDVIKIIAVTQGGKGAVVINPGGTNLRYTPKTDLTGLDSFTYTITDNRQGNGTATVTVTIVAVNRVPIASAGNDQAVKVGALVTLDASASSDPDVDPLSFRWKLTAPSGSTATLTGPTTVSPKFTADKPGLYVAEVVVSDGKASASASVKISSSLTNQAPKTSVSGPSSITLPATASLVGTATDDGLPNPPGKLSYSWTKVSGPGTVIFGSPASANSTATFSVAGIYVLRLTATDSALNGSGDITIDVKPTIATNKAPTVNAGLDQTITLPAKAALNGASSDDGLPNPPAKLTTTWSKVSGPGTVTFDSASSAITNAAFSVAGNYVLKLSGSDGVLTTTAQTTVIVNPAVINKAPVVSAGTDQTITLPAISTLTGSASDDGLPKPPAALTTTWSKLSGPGTVTFGNSAALSTTATFSTAGTYVLRLSVTDGALTTSASVSVIAKPASTNKPPIVSAGADQTISLPAVANLSGTGSDDGLPNPPAKFSVNWSKVSGPGSVTFGDSTKALTTATFSLPGTYVLRLSATDGDLAAFSQTTVIVNTAIVNKAPSVNAGSDITVVFPAGVTLNGTVTDDGLPAPPGRLSLNWSKVSGPGNVSFSAQNATSTTATFSAAGFYILRLEADDGELFLGDNINVTVIAPGTNSAPTVSAGASQTITLPNSARLEGVATDDGLPNPPGRMFFQWTKVSGPGDVSFDRDSSAVTFATFTAPGVYAIQLDASDSALTRSSRVTVTVKSASSGNFRPIVRAGEDQVVRLPPAEFLPKVLGLVGKVVDDGRPNPPAVLTTTWKQISGPAQAVISDPEFSSTPAQFTIPGVYVFRLSANDGQLTSSDDITIKVLPEITPKPIAEVAPVLMGEVGRPVIIDGTKSRDPNGLSLTFDWTLVQRPASSASFLGGNHFYPDVEGTYVVELRVDSGGPNGSSDPVRTVVTVSKPRPVTPTVTIAAPFDGSTFYDRRVFGDSGASVRAVAIATGIDSVTGKVDIYMNGLLIRGARTIGSNQWLNLTQLPIGTYTLLAKATDAKGNALVSTPVTFKVLPEPSDDVSLFCRTVREGRFGIVEDNPVATIARSKHFSLSEIGDHLSMQCFFRSTDGNPAILRYKQRELGTEHFKVLEEKLLEPNQKNDSKVVAPSALGVYEHEIELETTSGRLVRVRGSIIRTYLPASLPHIKSPQSGVNFRNLDPISIEPSIADDSDVDRVELQVLGFGSFGEDKTPPYSLPYTAPKMPWDATFAVGVRSVFGQLYSWNVFKGFTFGIETVSIHWGENKPPRALGFSKPTAGQTFTTADEIIISPSVFDEDGTLAKVEILDGSTRLGDAVINPITSIYEFRWKFPSVGKHLIKAKATDNEGASTETASLEVNVISAANVAILSPSNGTKFVLPSDINISVSASVDSPRKVSRIDVLINGTLIGSIFPPATSFVWRPVSGNGSTELRARVFDDQGHASDSLPVSIILETATAPVFSAAILSPTSGTVVDEGKEVTIEYKVESRPAEIAKVELVLDGAVALTIPTSGNSAQGTVGLRNLSAKSHQVVLRATDKNGKTASSAASVLIVNALPTVSINSPSGGESFLAPATIALKANATDVDGSITKVEFFEGTTPIGTALTAPYELNWTNVNAGSYAIVAIATDNRGAQRTSSKVLVRVSNVVVNITSPTSDEISYQDQILVSGRFAGPATSISVNGKAAVLGKGTFVASVPLSLGANSVSVIATGSGGNDTKTIIVTRRAPDVVLTSPAPGTTTNQESIAVCGNVAADEHYRVTVNNVTATILSNKFCVPSVGLLPGLNTIKVALLRNAQAIVERSLTVTRNNTTSSVIFITRPTTGIAPHRVDFSAIDTTQNTPLSIIVNSGGDGKFVSTDSNGGLTFEYTQPGIYVASVQASSSSGAIKTQQQTIVVTNADELDKMLRKLLSEMLLKLRLGNVEQALEYFTGGSKARFKALFEKLGPVTIRSLLDEMSEPRPGLLSNRVVEYAISRSTAGTKRLFYVYFIKCEDGMWRIDEM